MGATKLFTLYFSVTSHASIKDACIANTRGLAISIYAAMALGILLTGCSESSVPEKAELNYELPLYTVNNAMVCSSSILSEKRAGKDLAAATDAMLTNVGRTEAIKKVGCQEWKNGVRLYIPDNISQDLGRAGWKMVFDASNFTDKPLLIHDTNLTNENIVIKSNPEPALPALEKIKLKDTDYLATNLYKEYVENGSNADNNYNGRQITIGGTVIHIDYVDNGAGHMRTIYMRNGVQKNDSSWTIFLCFTGSCEDMKVPTVSDQVFNKIKVGDLLRASCVVEHHDLYRDDLPPVVFLSQCTIPLADEK